MNKIYSLILLLTALFITACERNDLWSKFEQPDTDPPSTITAVVSPPGGAWVARSGSINNTITVVFDTTMDTASLTMAGTLNSATAVWTTNDTLTLLPSSCTPGEGGTLTINCNSLEGESITLNLTYNIAESVYYVKANATGALTGTRIDPMNSIGIAAEDAYLSFLIPAVILVAEGNFTAGATMATLHDGVSIYGGYSGSDWEVRNPATHITRLVDTRTSLSITNPSNPARIIEVASGSSNTTVVDGFTLSIAGFTNVSTASAAAIFIDGASPVISNNIINSPDVTGGASCTTIGISHISGGSPTIINNTITLGGRSVTADGCNNYGIYSTDGTPTIQDNTIDAGEISGSATVASVTGLYLLYSDPTVNGNTIRAGNGISQSAGLHLIQCNGTYSNNTILAKGANISYGVLSTGSNAPVYRPIITNNEINGGTANTAFGIQFTEYTDGAISGNRISVNSAANSLGIDLKTGAVPAIYGNIITDLDGTDTRALTINIARSDTQVSIYNNIINGGGGTAINMGVSVTGESNILLANNIIKGGSGSIVNSAVYLDNSTAAPWTVAIANNNIFNDSGGYGINEATSSSSSPSVMKNNNIFHCLTLYHSVAIGDINNQVDIDNIDFAATDFDGNISENIYADLDSANDYRFTGVLSGRIFDTMGLDGIVWGYTTDRDGITRTGDWSIGAYEYD